MRCDCTRLHMRRLAALSLGLAAHSLSLYGWPCLLRCQDSSLQGVAIDDVHGASQPGAAKKQARSARSSEASLHTLGSAGSASGRARAGDARPRAPASVGDLQQRHRDAGRTAALSSGGDDSGMRLHALPDSPPRASPNHTQAVAPPQDAVGSPTGGFAQPGAGRARQHGAWQPHGRASGHCSCGGARLRRREGLHSLPGGVWWHGWPEAGGSCNLRNRGSRKTGPLQHQGRALRRMLACAVAAGPTPFPLPGDRMRGCAHETRQC